VGSPPRGARSDGHDSCPAARTATTFTRSRGGARGDGAELSASTFRRGASTQSAAMSIAGFLVNCSEFKDGLSINMTTKTFFTFRVIFSYPYSSTSMSRGLRRVVPAAAVTTHAKPHAQQQPPRGLEVERTIMGQHCRPQRFVEVHQRNPQPCRWLEFL